MSLKIALEKLLGAPCYHMVEVFPRPAHFQHWTDVSNGQSVDWDALFHGFAATVDWPSASFWPEISAKYPDAIILLSTRESADAWWKSASATIFDVTRRAPEGPMRTMFDAMMKSRFTVDFRDPTAAKAAYERHNAQVRATAPTGRLVDWKPGDGWGPLAAALHVPVPSEPFPHANTTEEFRARLASGPPPGVHH